jgi:GrpB-like predicted nucleotidyltransferase (UPF0157 family)/ribosomal protein S18 acetylase RimI-like enzyme
MLIREIRPVEYRLLTDFCYHAIFIPPGANAPSKEVLSEPSIHAYTEGFGKHNDICFVAEYDGLIVGAAWSRVFAESGKKGYGTIDDKTPELAISVLSGYRGRGIGTSLLTTLIDELAKRGYKKLSLSAQKENPAVRLYRQLGFETMLKNDEDYLMVRDLSRPWYDMDNRCLWRLFPIEVCPYNPAYPTWYQEATTDLTVSLGRGIERISHIGSTAVPGLAAKPIVDILLEVAEDTDIELILKQLKDRGWLLMSNARSPRLRIDLNKGYTPSGFAERVFHLHIVSAGDNDELIFRDWLKEHPEDCEAYAALKRQLAVEYKNDRDGYTSAKSEFINAIMARAKRGD